MRKPKTLEQVYDECLADGMFIEIGKLNQQKLRDMIENAEINIESAETLKKAIGKQDRKWMSVYIHYYESLRIYAEVLIQTSGKKISNHKCIFAFLCVKYPDLEFDWNFFEKIRIKRNQANYYGEKITYDHWKADELQFKVYISTLKKEVEKRLSEA